MSICQAFAGRMINGAQGMAGQARHDRYEKQLII
jgi:hypothetical protein